MSWARTGTWEGGYIRQRRGAAGELVGRPVFVIERQVAGRPFHVSTRCHQLPQATRQLARFEADPAAYSPAGTVAGAGAVRFTAALVDGYAEHQLAKGLTGEWVDEVSRCLRAWAAELGEVDLRRLDLHRDLLPALERWPRRRAQRVKALKGFFRWLRQGPGLVKRAEDPTVDLQLPQVRPERWRRRKVVAPEHVQAVLRHLAEPYRSLLHLLTATAWHVSEARRFAEAGELVRTRGRGGVVAVLMTLHKGGEVTRTPLRFPEHLEAAERVKGLTPWPKRMTLARKMRAACEAAGVPSFGMGVMRHSVLTWGRERGASMEELAEFAGHKSPSTTRRFYVDTATPTTAIPLRRLQLVGGRRRR